MLLGVIPARGGSKGIPYKNLMPFAGHPLIYWSIRDALQATLLPRFVVSTEDDKIAAFARECGAEVLPRPPELAGDQTQIIDVLKDILNKVPEAHAILLLQPTSPIRVDGLIDRVIAAWQAAGEPDSAASGFLCRMWEWGSRRVNLPRQVDPGYFYDDGNLYILSRKDLLQGYWVGERRVNVEVEPWYHYEIDTPIEAIAAEAVMKHLLTRNVKD
ncbi:MAG: acylneuraminate cytidylyltransferase family protein [Kiritimatiellae bacterium]|nr:acylneuraminate cytidylyltransferase family protein [Kiritimatiellia bacterium]